MKHLITFILCTSFHQAIAQNLQTSQPRCDQFETPVQDLSSKTGWKCVGQAAEQKRLSDAIMKAVPQCDQFETAIQDSSSKTGWKCINQAVEQQKRDHAFCEPNFDLTECVTPDGNVYKLQKNVNQDVHIPKKAREQKIPRISPGSTAQ